MGVWIETVGTRRRTVAAEVTPCVGVWIETGKDAFLSVSFRHTLRGCVDWNTGKELAAYEAEGVTPCVGVWIETGV